MPIEPPGLEAAGSQQLKREFLGLRFDLLDMGALARQLLDCSGQAPFAYVVTPNVDHVVRLHEGGAADRELIWDAYRGADWCVCDSRILARLASSRGVALPVVPGSDLAARLFESGNLRGRLVAVVGSTADAVQDLGRRFPEVRIIHHDPPLGLRHNQAALEAAADFILRARADFVILAVGSPQQELLAARVKMIGNGTGVGLCVGAAIDFLTDRQRRAPLLMQRLHLEWAHRLLSQPRRLWRRYLVDGPRIFGLVRRWRPPLEIERRP